MSERAFLKACRTGSQDEIETLLASISRPDQLRTKADETPLHLAIASHPKPAVIAGLLLARDHDPNTRGHHSQNKTPLHEAARRGHVEAVRVLLSAGARVDSVKSGDWTPLMLACAGGFHAVVDALLCAGASVTAVNRTGETALHLSSRQSVDCVKLVLATGADVGARTRNGRTALHYAARAGQTDGVKTLLLAGGDIRSVDKGGMNVVHEACVGGHADVVRLLMRLDGEAAWLVDCGGLTGLHHAAICGWEDIAQVLVGAADGDAAGKVEARDARRQTALCLAMFNGHAGVVRVLVAAGAAVRNEWLQKCRSRGRGDCKEIIELLGRVGRTDGT